jgi:Kef-type K+ transport system membrane component KefB
MSAKLAQNMTSKWKIYSGLVLLIAIGMLGYNVITVYVSYPTQKHREVARQITELDRRAYGSPSDQNPEGILKSAEYQTLQKSSENQYSSRSGIASGILGLILYVGVVATTYRFLRKHLVTRKPVGATVLINMVAATIVAAPTLYITQWIMGTGIDPLMGLLLLAALPFTVVFSVIITFIVAKITEWHYSRSHGFGED